MKISKERIIQAPSDQVYAAYADIALWKEVLDDVVDVKVKYDDGIHQEFAMTVTRNGQEETVHGIRFCFPKHSVELFQTTPPPLFKKMSGTWTFQTEGEATRVVAERNVEPVDEEKFDPSILGSFLEKNLEAFARYCEQQVSVSC